MTQTKLACRIIWVGVLLLFAGCNHAEQPSSASDREPLLLIAADGVEWKVLLPLMESGRMPVLTSLCRRGVAGKLLTLVPTASPIIWTTAATSKMPEAHGIEGFIKEKEGDRPPAIYHSTDRKTKAFWNILSERDMIVHVLGWWTTYPVEPINGVMLAQTNTRQQRRSSAGPALWKGTIYKGVPGQVWPVEMTDRIMQIVADVDADFDNRARSIFGQFKHKPAPLEELFWRSTRWSLNADAIYLRTARLILAGGHDYDVLAVYLGGTDVISHRFWRYTYPEDFVDKPTLEQIDDFGGIIEDYYCYVDGQIGELMADAGDDLTVIVVSDHGFIPLNQDKVHDLSLESGLINSAGHPSGQPATFIAAGPAIRQNHLFDPQRGYPDEADIPTLGRTRDICATILALKGLPVGQDMDGVPMISVLEPTFLAAHPTDTVPTYDTQEWLAQHQAREFTPIGEPERLEQLRALGYID